MRDGLKILIWKLLGKKFQQSFSFRKLKKSKDYRKFMESRARKRFLLLDTPEHGNLGDHAIVLSMRKFVQTYFPEQELYEFTFDECRNCLEKIEVLTNKEDVILLPGGGFLGTLWLEEEENVLHILEMFQENKIIIFPQTLFFEETEAGRKERGYFFSAVGRNRHVSLFLRDEKSFLLVKKQGEEKFVDIAMTPDIVTWLYYGKKTKKPGRKKVLICFREDKERVLDEKNVYRYRKILVEMGCEIKTTSTVLSHRVSKETREAEVRRKLAQFSKADLVLTDRLHGMIFSAITATPCIALDNASGKVSGGYEWLKHLGYVKLIQQEDQVVDTIQQLLEWKGMDYDCRPYEQYYEQIRNVIWRALGIKGELL